MESSYTNIKHKDTDGLYNDIDLKNIKKCNIIFDRTNSGDLLFESIMVD